MRVRVLTGIVTIAEQRRAKAEPERCIGGRPWRVGTGLFGAWEGSRRVLRQRLVIALALPVGLSTDEVVVQL